MMRELGEVLAASGLGLVARHDHPHVADILLRIQNLYTGNYRFLDLLKSVNLAEVRASQTDLEILKTHSSSQGLITQQNETPSMHREPNVPSAPPACLPHPLPDSFRARARRRLSPGVVGKAWRVSKRVVARVRRELSPGVVGKSWRLSKRVLRKSTTLIR